MKNNTKDDKILIFVSVALIFLCGILPDEVILVIQLLLLVSTKRTKISKCFSIIIILILMHGIINITLNNDNILLIFKQIIGIFISYMFYYNIIKDKKDINYFFKMYLNFSIIVSAMCIIQQIAYIAHLNLIYDMRWLVKNQLAPASVNYRSIAIYREPSECALILLPGVFLSIYYFIGKNKLFIKEMLKPSLAILIIIGFFLTFSSAGYMGVGIALIVMWKEYKHSLKQIFILTVLIITTIGLYENVPDFKSRLNDTFAFIIDTDKKVGTMNISSQTLIINEKIALKSFFNTYGLGGGIGSHFISYEKYINTLNNTNIIYFFNQEDANSLLLRIISELGIIGVLILVIFIKKYKNQNIISIYSIYRTVCVVYFILRLLRYGHYFNDGLWAFIVVYMLIKNLNKNLNEREKSYES